MKVAVVGSRGCSISHLDKYLPQNTTELISGGAKGIDTCVREYAKCKGIKITEYLPDYRHYGRAAPIRRNELIVKRADAVLAFWDGISKGTAHVIQLCHTRNIPISIYIWIDNEYRKI